MTEVTKNLPQMRGLRPPSPSIRHYSGIWTLNCITRWRTCFPLMTGFGTARWFLCRLFVPFGNSVSEGNALRIPHLTSSQYRKRADVFQIEKEIKPQISTKLSNPTKTKLRNSSISRTLLCSPLHTDEHTCRTYRRSSPSWPSIGNRSCRRFD